MKTKIAFIFTCKDEKVDWKVEKLVWKLSTKLKKYRVESYMGSLVYYLDQDSELYGQVVETYHNNKDSITFQKWYFHVQATEEEMEKSIAFIPIWPQQYCEEYMDISYEYKKCKYCGAKEKSEDVFYVQPTGYIKKNQDKYGIATYTGLNEIVLLPKLVEKLIKEGVEESYFTPVISKTKKVMGYVFDTPHILPEGSYFDSNYNRTIKCLECGAVSMEENKEEGYIQKKFLTLPEESAVPDVSYTYEFYDGHRELLISPKVQKIIQKYVKNAMFIPVFKQ